ncbi:hypothetical protein SK069_15650 [Patulibacter brassicae]|uniref:DUF4439 domain-containing protein n=1 Tax=Patulibacter brassicae TaxID=1705717 RepID=A0ABU4VPQ6_9ACTN|nr:hypothetical protein [Patulibacter brassicae]MDX8153034.1 hypothetical protein [Patulibacter brassicae]
MSSPLSSARGPASPGTGRRRLLGVAAAVVVLAALALVLWPEGDGDPVQRRAATTAVERLARQLDARPGPRASAMCRAVGPATRRRLASLAPFDAQPGRGCAALPRRVIRITLEPLAGTADRALDASVDGDEAVVRLADGPEVSRATRRAGGRWIADPAAGGVGAWRLETARRCSAALTRARLAPLSLDADAYRTAVATRLQGVSAVLEMLQRDAAPEALRDAVAQPRAQLAELRDGLRRGLLAVDGGNLTRDAPSTAELPSLLQLLESFPALRDLGVPCLGGPAVPPSVITQGNAACEAVRPAIESAYRDAGRATSNLAVGAAFDQLAGAWSGFSQSIGALPLSAAPRLRPVRGDAVRSSRRAGQLAAQLATAARTNADDTPIAQRLDLAQQTMQDALMALGLRNCGAIGV